MNTSRYFTLILVLSLATLVRADNIDSLLQVILAKNLELKALSTENSAKLNERKSDNQVSGPSIEYSPFYTKGYHGMASSELVVTQEFDFPTRYAQRKRQLELEVRIMESQYDMRAREIALEARLLCYEVICKNQIIDLLRQRLQQGASVTTLLEKRFRAGDSNKLEVNKAQLEYKQTQKELAEMENERHQLLMQLQLLNANQPVSIADTTFPTLPQPASSDQPHYPVHLPEVSEAERALEASTHQHKVSSQEWLPSLSIGYRRNTDESLHLNGFLVGASFPMFRKATLSKATRQQMEADRLRLEQVKQKAENEQRMRHDELIRIHHILDHSDTDLLHETLSLLATAMQHGQITALQYYTECDDIYTKLFNHINLHCSYVQLYAQLYNR